MSQQQSPHSSSSSQQPSQYTPPPQQDNLQQQVIIAQPTVRVMRLYKPCMHVIPTLPPTIESTTSKNADFAISPFLLLPDSFGDIYTGELFSAYIAVVNGNQDNVLNQVTLSVRLQTTNATHDLLDCRPVLDEISGTTKVLSPNAAVDVVVKHTLTELGTHTLRVSVQYSSRFFTEPKTLRKFYRFNVLQPLSIVSSGTDVGDRILVQSLVTNTTKSPLFIEEMSFQTVNKDAVVTLIEAPRDINSMNSNHSDHLNLNSLPLLLPEESYAAVFSVSKIMGEPIRIIGSPQMKWCSYMGEHGLVTGNEVVLTSSNFIASQITPQQQQLQQQIPQQNGTDDIVYIDCISSPSSAIRSTEFEIILRITNNASKNLNLQLVCKDKVSPSYSTSSGKNFRNLSLSDSTHGPKKGKDHLGSQESSQGSHENGTFSQLFVTGLSTKNLGEIKFGSFIDVTLSVCAVDIGLQELKGVVVVDIATGREFSAKSLLKIMVLNATVD